MYTNHKHTRMLWLYVALVFGQWLDYLTQVYQVYILGWQLKAVSGLFGLWFPDLVEAEVLHFGYNLLLFVGIFLLRNGFRGHARTYWNLMMAVQTWHLMEHTLLQLQQLTRQYPFDATEPTGMLQLWIPRVELHFLYILAVLVLMSIAIISTAITLK